MVHLTEMELALICFIVVFMLPVIVWQRIYFKREIASLRAEIKKLKKWK